MRFARIVVFLAASILFVASTTQAASCSNFLRCSECVFDSSDGVLSTPLPCSWCATTSACIYATSSDAAVCPDIRNTTYNPTCPDMQCSAAYTSNNIYFCRGPVIAALIFAIILLFIDALFFVWLKALWQLPWKYANINNYVADHVTRSGSVLASLSAPPVVDVTLKSRAGVRTGSSCPICKVLQADPLGPGEVCFWCDVARYAFFPFYIGVIGAGLTIGLVFCLPLKPWFSDWYYAFLLVTPYVSYTVFAGYIFICRVSIVGDSSQKVTTFFQLAWILRGRDMKAVFPRIDEGPASVKVENGSLAGQAKPAGAAPPVPAAVASVPPLAPKSAMSEEFIQARKAETVQLLNLDILPKEFRKILQADFNSDEFILWWEQPTSADIIGDLKWLIHACVTAIALGVWFWIAASVYDRQYPITRMYDSGSLTLIGTVITFCGIVVLMVTLMGCSRMYVLTNRRLLIVSGGVLGAHVTGTDIQSVKYASIYGYTEWKVGPVLTFSWEIPAELRKMPPIATKAFAAIDDVDGFLEAFRRVAPKFQVTEVIRTNISHTRAVWRMHIFFNLAMIAIIPIMVLYSQLAPNAVDLFLLCVIVSINVCLIQRGLRQQQITYAPLNMVNFWAHWDEQESDQESFLSTFLKDSQFHWMSKPHIHLPNVNLPKVDLRGLAEKVKNVAVSELRREHAS